MKKNKKNYLDIEVPKTKAFTIETNDDFIAMHAVILAVAKRGVGKSVAFSNMLRMMKQNNALDRLLLVSPTYHNNTHLFENLPFDPENDLIEPEKHTPELLIDILDDMGKEYDDYFVKLEQWKELQKQIRSKRNIDDIDDDLLFTFVDDFDKPTYKYMRNGKAYKPSVVIFFDDCQGSSLFAPSSKLSNLVIKHRHLGKTIHKALGCTLMSACQSYTSNSNGLPKSIRTNLTHMLIFKNKSLKELYAIAEEVAGEITQDQFFEVYEKAMVDPHDFLFIDLHKKKTHPSMFRRNMSEFINVNSIEGVDHVETVN